MMESSSAVEKPDLRALADRIAQRAAARDRITDRRRAWQDRAAVLAWFLPEMIGAPATGEARLGDEDWLCFLADTEPAVNAKGGARQLREPVRRSVLMRLGPRGWQGARTAVPNAPNDPVQQMLDALLAARPPQLEELDRNGLDTLIAISRWLIGIVPTLPPEAALLAATARKDLLEPLRRLTEHFVGRETELDTLRAYVEEIVPKGKLRRITAYIGNRVSDLLGRKALFLHGLGGVGKSTLVARFLLEHAERGLPFVYIDLDRPSIDPRNTLAVLAEAQRQLTLQAPHTRMLAEKLAGDFEQAASESASSEASRSEHSLDEALSAFVGLVDTALPRERRLPFVIDTFEDAQALGDQGLTGLATLILKLPLLDPRIRPVICGRVAPDDDLFEAQKIPIRVLEPEQATSFLQALLANRYELKIEQATLEPLVRAISRTPLALSFAAQTIAQEGVEQIPQPRFMARMLPLTDAAELYSRVLGHIKEPQLRALAKPGLLVRRLTPAVVHEVLAAPCGLTIKDETEAAELLRRLAREVSLVEREPDGALRHRQELRRQMLPSLEREVSPDVARQINEAALNFYAKPDRKDLVVALAERLYHLLRMGEVAAAEAIWSNHEETQPAVDRLRSAVDELRPDPRRALKLRLGLRLTGDERQAANQDEWERAAAAAAGSYLADGAFEAAKGILSERGERLPDSRLPLLEVEALSGLRDWSQVIEVAIPSAERAAAHGNSGDACALLFAASRAYEALGDLGGALDSLARAEVEARRSGEVKWLLRLEATRARIAPGHGGHFQGELTGKRQAIEELKASGVIDRLAGAALREVAAAFGHVDSGLVRTALYRLGLPELTQAMISRLANMLADKARASPEEFEVFQSVLAPLHEGTLPKNKTDPDEWGRWILEVPKVRLGQALAELTGQGTKLLPGLLGWAQSALQGRVERDVHRSGMGGSA